LIVLAEHSSLRSLGVPLGPQPASCVSDDQANARFPDVLTQMFAELIGGVCGTQQKADHHPRCDLHQR
jgi:hypothetical protein